MTAPIKLASLVGKLKISAENSQVQVINVGAFDDPAGLLDTSLVPLDDTATGLRTTQGNTVVVPSRASRNDITIRAVGGPIRYGYTDIPDLHLKGFLIDEGDSMRITSPLAIFVTNPISGSAEIEVNFDEVQGQ